MLPRKLIRHRLSPCLGQRLKRCAAPAFAAVLMAGTALPAAAQLVAIDLRPKHSSYVVGEPVAVQLVIENHGAQPIVIGEHEAFANNHVFFEIRDAPNEFLAKRHPGKIIEELDLEFGEALTTEIDLGRHYRLLQPRRYYVRAVLISNDRRYVSGEQVFEVVPGIALARHKQVMRVAEGVIERDFTLVYWSRADREDAFLKVVDQPGSVTWATLNLGSIVRVKAPTMRAGDDNTVLIDFQASRDVLITSVIRSDAAGPVLVEQRPTLDTVSSPMVDALEGVLEKTPEKRRSPWWRRR